MVITKKDRKIANQKAMISNRDEMINRLKEENLCLYQENKDLRFEHEEIKELLLNILDRAVTCPLGNEKIALDKIKELVRDYQSEN